MKKIIDLEAYFNNKKAQIESYSMLDMIFDPKKREEVYKYYDSNYKETDEENRIFQEWQQRNTKRNKMGQVVISEDEEEDKCEWDIIADIFTNAAKKKGLTKEQVENIIEKIKKETKD
ncbi:hypothetical protein CF087_22495 [Clostridium botulinum]|uniref:hypothetical protein n=1 Tax=Clostridium botulinum TaxID=1491 RepID=UPI00196A156E|nr:hypothetical protein [Clostridium botulinum]MBN3371792.1 hypothetical protein [Clostridium botulinum]MBN3376598.1 hypothetical protein [Clostridium botulinum]